MECENEDLECELIWCKVGEVELCVVFECFESEVVLYCVESFKFELDVYVMIEVKNVEFDEMC